jgi:Tfp pilus assembly protein PilX
MRRLLREEDGLALALALGVTVVLGIATTSMIMYTTSSQRNAQRDSADLVARTYAEAGLNTAYAIIFHANTTSGLNPTAANMLGCNGYSGPTDTSGPSNCAAPVRQLACIVAGCTAGSPGSVSYYGFFSGTNPASYLGLTVPASTWLIVSTGYDRNANGLTVGKTAMAEVTISPLSSGAVASVWNHVFITSPLVANQCQLDFSGNNMTVNVPVYVIGNMCLGNSVITESGQPVDVQVGGKLYLTGGSVGASSASKITSGVVVGGCTTVSISAATSPCDNGTFHWWVTTPDTFVAQAAPSLTSTDIASDYASFDPGPAHPCAVGNNPYAPLPSTTFDTNSVYDVSAATFTLTPSTSYACISQSGSSVGQLVWNASTRQLTINGSVFIDGSVIISQALTYSGTGIIEAAGTITFNGNGTTVCAVASCVATNWQGTSGNNQMLTLAALASNTTAITFTNNAQSFQGSLWTQPSSAMTFVKNGVTVQGPMSIGKFDSSFNNAALQPLPVIKNMPAGAPVPPNTSASVGPLVIVGQ